MKGNPNSAESPFKTSGKEPNDVPIDWLRWIPAEEPFRIGSRNPFLLRDYKIILSRLPEKIHPIFQLLFFKPYIRRWKCFSTEHVDYHKVSENVANCRNPAPPRVPFDGLQTSPTEPVQNNPCRRRIMNRQSDDFHWLHLPDLSDDRMKKSSRLKNYGK